ncbi:TonB-dependent receptor [Paraferrimonas sedimenticola]|uniref:Oar protein n=1 Tax=Paraferrimonas sedimenticola TaxID=375674 RepID=A0AA37RV56_9GAMM|nr:TonB-dependent receptor [Paraferrimonas sedimenticola]GLP95167.1 Oar protein [Paraferrimonas sedimenticola]
MNLGNKRLTNLSFAVALALGAALPAHASETASNIRGAIVADDGSAVTDAKITIIHQPTGTVTEVEVNEEGKFNARGLRVGGPYAIVVDSDEYQDDYAEGLYINLGETLRFNRTLNAEVASSGIERIAVTGNAKVYQSASSNSEYGAKEIANAPGISRDLKDVVRQNPLAVVGNDGKSLSVAGLNPKFNSFVVDGVQQNDDFGLNSNGYPTQRSPISLEAVESVALNTSPFSAKYGGFSGAQINAVTKSGTNEVKGSFFAEHTGDQLAGRVYNPQTGKEGNRQDFSETTMGGSIGLPLVKDKLFFFGAYERFNAPKGTTFGPKGAGYSNESGVTKEDAERIQKIAKERYGLDDIGGWTAKPIEQDEKLLAKLDWNINDDHRASYTYQRTIGNVTNNTIPRSKRDLNLSSNWYNKQETLNSHAFNLYSDWSSDFNTEIKVAYKDVESRRNPVTPMNIGQVSVETGNGRVNFGTEQNSHSNELDNRNLELRFAANYMLGDHEISFGVQHNDVDIYNAFAPHTLGTWEFASIEDFEKGIPSRFKYAVGPTDDPRSVGAKFDMKTTALFLEDNWMPTDNLELTAGVRYERVGMDAKPTENANFVKRYGFSNTATMDGKEIFLPRVGFKYFLENDMVLRGGIGRFSGGYPNVWMSNSFSNDGTRVRSVNVEWDKDWGPINDFTPPAGIRDQLPQGDGNVDSLDPNFKLPSDYRFSLALEGEVDLGFMGKDWFFGTEYLHIQRENDVRWVDLTRLHPESGRMVDGTGRVISRPWDPIGGPDGKGGYTDRRDLMLTNAERDGKSQNLSFSLAKEWDSGFRIRGVYALNRIEEGNQGSSAIANSNYKFPVVGVDRNGTTLGPGMWETPQRFTLTMGYDKQFFDGYNTGFNLFFEAKQGNPLNITMHGCMPGEQNSVCDSRSNAYLPYIPTGPNDPNVRFKSEADYNHFMKTVNELGLGKYAGGFVPKGALNQPWVNTLDFRVTQEIPGFTKEHKGLLYVDVRNVLNLLNKDWGHVKYQNFGNKSIGRFDVDESTGQLVYSSDPRFVNSQNWNMFDVHRSAWQVKVGVRYLF